MVTMINLIAKILNNRYKKKLEKENVVENKKSIPSKPIRPKTRTVRGFKNFEDFSNSVMLRE